MMTTFKLRRRYLHRVRSELLSGCYRALLDVLTFVIACSDRTAARDEARENKSTPNDFISFQQCAVLNPHHAIARVGLTTVVVRARAAI
jgi:hypothetical protein